MKKNKEINEDLVGDEFDESEQDFTETEANETADSRNLEGFESLNLKGDLLRAVSELGYETATPIQLQTIPAMLEGKDVLGLAQTGTGKTAAFALPILQNLDVENRNVQALILAPTRELAIQVAEAFHSYSKHLGKVRVLPIYGGQAIGIQLKHLEKGAHIVVGTPGRVIDHLKRGSLDLSNLKQIVLDEADEMLRMGFIEDIEWILENLPEDRQTALFSATMPKEVRRIAENYQKNPFNVEIERKTLTVPSIKQFYVNVSEAGKLDVLTRLLEIDSAEGEAVIIFDRTKIGAANLAEKLQARGYAAEAMHGDMTQMLRENVIRRLKSGQIEIVVATDVAARGLDVEHITRVINYDMPSDAEVYIHRIGRTGRAGRGGTAILFVTSRQQRMKREIERFTKQPMEALKLPSKADLAKHRFSQFKKRVLSTLVDGELDIYLSLVEELIEESGADTAEIAAAMARLASSSKPLNVEEEREIETLSSFERDRGGREFSSRDRGINRERSERGNNRDSNERRDYERSERGGFDRGERTQEKGMTRLFFDVGRNSSVTPSDIVGALANEGGIFGRSVGGIEIFEDFSFVDVPSDSVGQILERMQKTKIRRHNANIRLAEGREQTAAKKKGFGGGKPFGAKKSFGGGGGRKPFGAKRGGQSRSDFVGKPPEKKSGKLFKVKRKS